MTPTVFALIGGLALSVSAAVGDQIVGVPISKVLAYIAGAIVGGYIVRLMG